MNKVIEKDSGDSTSARAAAEKARAAAKDEDPIEDAMEEDGGNLEDHSTATARVDVLGVPFPKRPRTGCSTFSSSACAGGPSPVKPERAQPGNAGRPGALDEGRAREAEAPAVGGFHASVTSLLGVASRSTMGSASATVSAAADVLKVVARVCHDVMLKSLEVHVDAGGVEAEENA